jgi:hypothetical protein
MPNQAKNANRVTGGKTYDIPEESSITRNFSSNGFAGPPKPQRAGSGSD